MKNLNIVVYTMKGCPFCDDFKKMLTEEDIEFIDRDIHEHESEYNVYSEITNNDMIPALLIIEGDDNDDDNYDSYLYAPERNYNELTEAIDIINEHRKKLGII
jgi:glutaredoxin